MSDVELYWRNGSVHNVENVELPQFDIVEYRAINKIESLLTGTLLILLRFNATVTVSVLSLRSVTQVCFLAASTNTTLFPKPPTTLFTCFGEITPERKLASTGYRTHNHQVMSQTRSPLRHQDGQLTGMTRSQGIICLFLYA